MESITQALQSLDVQQVEALLQADPDLVRTPVFYRDPRGETLLHLIVPDLGKPTTPDHLKIAGLLLDAGADIDAAGYPANNEGGTPLIYAAWADQPELVRLFLQHGADTNRLTLRGESAIDTAARHGNTRIVEALVEAGAAHTFTHLLQAGLIEQIERLLDADPALLHAHDDAGNLPIHHVVGPENRYDPALLHLLITRGADIEARDSLGRTALHCALDAERQNAVELLLSYGAAIDLFAAAGLGDTERVKILLHHRPEAANDTQRDGLTPLFYAARYGHVPIARQLLAQRAVPAIYVNRWWMEPTPLHAAAFHGHEPMCRLLIESGSRIDERNEQGYTPLVVAARWKHEAIVALLLDSGADLYAADNNGCSALDWVVDKLPLTQLLVARGFDVNRKAPPGSWSERTALHFAAAGGHKDVIRFLLASGADPTLTDRHGRTPQQILPQSVREKLKPLFKTSNNTCTDI